MGEAKRKASAYDQAKNALLKTLSGDAVVVATDAINLFERFILPNKFNQGCYITTMVLHKFLKEERGIITKPVVGYVNDGTDDIMVSHAWLEFEGAKTDLTLNVTDARINDPGALLILDHPVRPGILNYSYHIQRTPEALRAMLELLQNSETALTLVRHKEVEHKEMAARACNPALLDAYIESAPSDQDYSTMTAVLR